MADIKEGTKIRVHGWVMLKGLDSGDYVIHKVDDISYWFRKPRGKKTVCRHYISDIMGSVGSFEKGNNNGIEIL